MRAHRNSDPASIPSAKDWKCRHYFYEYHQAYGSKQYDVKPVKISSITLSPDKKSMHLQVANLKADRLYEFRLPALKSTNATPIRNSLLLLV